MSGNVLREQINDWMNIQAIFNALKGSWDFYRTITGEGWVKGKAQFSEVAANQLHYKEEGIFHLSAKKTQHPIIREYFYHYHEAENKISVYFANDDKPTYLLHDLNFVSPNLISTPTATGIHHCKFDIYEAEYNFLTDREFKLTYKVHGPSKNYVAVTLFKR